MAKATPRGQKVRVGSVTLSVTPWRHPSGRDYWRFWWYDSHGKRKFGTRSSKSDALEAARQKAKEIHNGSLDLSELTPPQLQLIRRWLEVDPSVSEIEQFLAWKSRNQNDVPCASLSEIFLAEKRDSGISEIYLNVLRMNLSHFTKKFGEHPLSSIETKDLDDWFNKAHGAKSAKTKNNHRATLVSFWKWARMKGYAEDAISPAERLTITRFVRKQPPTFSVEQADILIAQVAPVYLPWLVMCGWGGCRTEEVCPHPTSSKPPLDWQDFQWERGFIILRAETSKTREKRIIPINETIQRHLEPIAKKSGRLVEALPPAYSGRNAETTRLGKFIGGWKKNGLRNSFISYRGAIIGLAKTALEAGNSEGECRRSYNDAVLEEDAKKWFQL
ncbi:site-specific integrase [Roseibacillus persicicus]|uniref:site-specific integrase n=1 Tax=Roseibacillus persicicus TaxID=454148 RepID=UPI00398ADF7C